MSNKIMKSMCCLCIQFTHENTSERTILHQVSKIIRGGGTNTTRPPLFQVWLIALQNRLATPLLSRLFSFVFNVILDVKCFCLNNVVLRNIDISCICGLIIYIIKYLNWMYIQLKLKVVLPWKWEDFARDFKWLNHVVSLTFNQKY